MNRHCTLCAPNLRVFLEILDQLQCMAKSESVEPSSKMLRLTTLEGYPRVETTQDTADDMN